MRNYIEIEAILNGDKQEIELPVTSHVNKYVEQFLYKKFINLGGCRLDYFEHDSINSDNNIYIYDMSSLTNRNERTIYKDLNQYIVSKTNTINTVYKEIMITNKLTRTREGKEIPLFRKHILPEGTTEADIEVISNNDMEINGSYEISIEDGCIYTNYENSHERKTGFYTLFFVISSDDKGNSKRELLNTVDTVRKLVAEDIDLNTGLPKAGIAAFSRQTSAAGFVFNVVGGGPWYWKPSEASMIFIKKPSGLLPIGNWNVSIANGNFKTVSNGILCNYWLPEYAQQPFTPFNPYTFAINQKMHFVNDRTLAFNRRGLKIDKSNFMHLEIYIYDENDQIIDVYTTNTDKRGLEVQNYSVIYNVDAIESWDEVSGIVSINEKIESRNSYFGYYYYTSDEYEMKEISFNPLQNKVSKDYRWIIYCIPNLAYDEKAIHYLGVDRDGMIRYCSQSFIHPGYPNLQVKDSSGNYNPDTMIGSKYEDSTGESFIEKYSNFKKNDYQYMVLGEISILDKSLIDDSILFDVRLREWLKKDSRANVFRKNPRIANSKYGYGENGHEFSQNNTMVYEIPIKVLKEYGGDFNKDELDIMLKEHTQSSKKNIFILSFLKPDVSFINTVANEITFNISYEGSLLTYRVYRKEKISDSYEVVKTFENPTTALSWTDANLQSKIYYYAFTIEEDGTEYPKSNFLSIRVET